MKELYSFLSEKIRTNNLIRVLCQLGFGDYTFITENLSHKFDPLKIYEHLSNRDRIIKGHAKVAFWKF